MCLFARKSLGLAWNQHVQKLEARHFEIEGQSKIEPKSTRYEAKTRRNVSVYDLRVRFRTIIIANATTRFSEVIPAVRVNLWFFFFSN